jgi:hypothetical protein
VAEAPAGLLHGRSGAWFRSVHEEQTFRSSSGNHLFDESRVLALRIAVVRPASQLKPNLKPFRFPPIGDDSFPRLGPSLLQPQGLLLVIYPRHDIGFLFKGY